MHYLLLLNNLSAELQENINWKPHYYIKKTQLQTLFKEWV